MDIIFAIGVIFCYGVIGTAVFLLAQLHHKEYREFIMWMIGFWPVVVILYVVMITGHIFIHPVKRIKKK